MSRCCLLGILHFHVWLCLCPSIVWTKQAILLNDWDEHLQWYMLMLFSYHGTCKSTTVFACCSESCRLRIWFLPRDLGPDWGSIFSSWCVFSLAEWICPLNKWRRGQSKEERKQLWYLSSSYLQEDKAVIIVNGSGAVSLCGLHWETTARRGDKTEAETIRGLLEANK